MIIEIVSVEFPTDIRKELLENEDEEVNKRLDKCPNMELNLEKNL